MSTTDFYLERIIDRTIRKSKSSGFEAFKSKKKRENSCWNQPISHKCCKKFETSEKMSQTA